MQLSPADIDAIATAVVRKLKATEEMKLDTQFDALDLVTMKEKNKLKVAAALRAEKEKNKR